MSANPFYNSPGWIKARRAALIRDKYLCQKCLRRGRFRRATTVHHKVHLCDRPDMGLALDNIESLCAACHNEEHPEKRARRKREPGGAHCKIYKL